MQTKFVIVTRGSVVSGMNRQFSIVQTTKDADKFKLFKTAAAAAKNWADKYKNAGFGLNDFEITELQVQS